MDPIIVDNSWATRRRAIILGAMILILSAISFGVFWKFWYAAPTCFDKVENGDETGIDCGGSCSLICRGDILKPIVKWDPRLFEVLPGLWSALIYVENPNTDVDATYVPYTFTIYDQNNKVIEEKKGATILPKNKTVGIFEGNITVSGEVKPKRAIFELGDNIVWKKDETPALDISITNGPILRLDSEPRVLANVKNNSAEEIKNIELVIAIFDGSDNAIAASRTFVESLQKNENANIFFTWPKPFKLGSKACEKSSDIVLAIDRSGSMQSINVNPPEPLTGVKIAASDFVSLLGKNNSVGLVSFSTDAQIESELIKDFSYASSLINGITINKESVQYTNIADALASSFGVLGNQESQRQKVIILLTDGIANRPIDSASKTEAEEIAYAENEALKVAKTTKENGVIIYTIGLGKDIHTDFLKQIASSADKFFPAPTALDLGTIYEGISSDICKEMPARIEINYKIFGNAI
jgi:Mg-chelatase subunit ChlD